MRIRVSNAWTDAESKVRKKLRDYRALVAKYKACKAEFDMLFPSCTSVLTGMPKVEPDGYEPERWASKRIRQEEKMAQSIEDMRREYEDAEKMVQGLEADEEAIIRRHFFQGQSIELISKQTHWSMRSCYRLQKSALRKMVKKQYGI